MIIAPCSVKTLSGLAILHNQLVDSSWRRYVKRKKEDYYCVSGNTSPHWPFPSLVQLAEIGAIIMPPVLHFITIPRPFKTSLIKLLVRYLTNLVGTSLVQEMGRNKKVTLEMTGIKVYWC